MSFFSNYSVYDRSGKQIASGVGKKSAQLMARAIGGSARKGNKNPMTKKKKKKAKRKPAKKNKRSTSRNKKQTRSKPKKRSTARSKGNPGAKLKAKISQMKPGSWYPTTLSGARVKVQRKGSSLIIRPASKKRSR